MMSDALPSSSKAHRATAQERGPVHVAIVSVSDTRTIESDANGAFLRQAVTSSGHRVVDYVVIRDEPAEVAATLDRLSSGEARVIIFNGGTGIAPRDTTIDVVERRLEKTLPGFGELFRMLSYEQVGAAAMLSRAAAGVFRGKVVICTPGSPAAVRLAWEKLIQPELAHLAWEVAR